MEGHISLSEQTSIRLRTGYIFTETHQPEGPPTHTETALSPEAGRSSDWCLLTAVKQLRERGPTIAKCGNEQVVTYQQNKQDAGAASEYEEQGCQAGGKHGLPSRGDVIQLLIAALFPGEPKFQDTVPKPAH